MPVTLSAANRLRNQVLSVPGTVLLVNSGYPDKIIRFQNLPAILAEYKKTARGQEGQRHVTIDLGNGPASEAWRDAMDVVRRTSRRDRPIPEPIEVSANSREDWSVGDEDIPVIENAIEAVSVPTPRSEAPSFDCDQCGKKGFANEKGLKIHKAGHIGK